MTLSCSTAAGRWRSAATSSGLRPCDASSRASLPQVVVLPEPCRPQSIRIVGPVFSNRIDGSTGPISSTSSSWTILTICCSGRTLLINCVPTARSLTRAMNSWTTLIVDVGLEQRRADLAQAFLDVRFGQDSARAEPPEGGGESFLQVVEHDDRFRPRYISWIANQ